MSEQLVMATKKQRHGAYPACVYHQRQKSPPSAPFRQGTTLSSVRVAFPLEPFSPVRYWPEGNQALSSPMQNLRGSCPCWPALTA
jgi:hypothetical protein